MWAGEQKENVITHNIFEPVIADGSLHNDNYILIIITFFYTELMRKRIFSLIFVFISRQRRLKCNASAVWVQAVCLCV